LPGDDAREMTIWANQEAGGVGHVVGMCAPLASFPHTPPQVDISACKKRNARVVGKRARRAPTSPTSLTPHIIQRTPHNPLSKKTSAHALFVLIVKGYDETASVKPFALLAECTSHKRGAFLRAPHHVLNIDAYERERSSYQHYCGTTDVQTYSCPVGILRRASDRRTADRTFLMETPGGPISEGGQKKGGDQPGPEKQKPPAKPGTKKPEREGNIGVQRVKRPKKRIGAPDPPEKEQGLSGLGVVLRWLRRLLPFLPQRLLS